MGSGASDLRAWLARGGMPRVKERLNEQMERRQFSPEQQAAVHRTLAQLEESHRDALQALIAAGVIEMFTASP